jgi:hypothetical protein
MLRLGGAESVDAGRMLANLAKNLYKANEEGGAAADALHTLGMLTTDFSGKDLAESFEMIARSVGRSGKSTGELVDALGELFGGRIGYKTIALFKEFSATQDRAGRNTEAWGRYLEKNAERLDDMGDAMGRFTQIRMGFASIVIDEMQKFMGMNDPNAFFDAFDPEKFRPGIASFFDWIEKNIKGMSFGDALKNVLSEIGNMIGKGIAEGVKSSGLSIGDLLPWGKKGSDKSTTSADYSGQFAEQINLLRDIKSRVGVTSIA